MLKLPESMPLTPCFEIEIWWCGGVGEHTAIVLFFKQSPETNPFLQGFAGR